MPSIDRVKKIKAFSSLETVCSLLWIYRGKSAIVLIALLISGIAGGLGILALLPLLEITIGGAGSESEHLLQYTEFLAIWGLTPTIGTTLLIIVIFLWIKSILHLIAMDYVGGVVAKMASDLRIRLMRAIADATWSFFVRNPIGKFTNSAITHPQEASSAYRASCQFIASIFEVIILITASLLISPLATLGGFIFGVLIVVLMGKFVSMSRLASGQTFKAMETLSSRLTDLLQGIKPLKAMNCESRLAPILENESNEINKATRKQVFAKHGLSIMREPIASLVIALGIYFALTASNIGMAELLTTVILFHRISVGINSIQSAFQLVASSERYYWGLNSLTDEAVSNAEQNNDAIWIDAIPDWAHIKFENVCFSYGTEEVLNDVSFEIERNTLTAIVGPSGSGKTTLIDILCGIVRPDSGSVTVGDVRVSGISIDVWRGAIGYVPQDLFLSNDSILNNITLRDPALSRLDVERALKSAEAWEFVRALPQGLDTSAGERGLMLSGGQRQRISIARALVRQPQLLILDEATTALDPATEQGIISTLHELKKAVTVVAVSHQPSLTTVADRVVEVRQGAVSEVQRD